ncbi:hypothetical protein BV898_04384 [Hypsibius exemplaris]|uniref:Uncharacterized protein n=1 Tax=Hypsibius exemplaris TaxID=2072580 RepID=A0A1W0X2W2_HYPEX|nr:hypothetical protein BV898_04384 [Hypsibius exemplaris]
MDGPTPEPIPGSPQIITLIPSYSQPIEPIPGSPQTIEPIPGSPQTIKAVPGSPQTVEPISGSPQTPIRSTLSIGEAASVTSTISSLGDQSPSHDQLTSYVLPHLTSSAVAVALPGENALPSGITFLTAPQQTLKPLSPVPEDLSLPRAGTPASAVSSASSIGGEVNFSQSFVFQDLHEIEQRVESNYIYAVIEQAFDAKAVTYAQATHLRNKVAGLVDVYDQRYRHQKNMQDLVMNQIRYYQEHYEELYDAETLPWRMRQQLQGLRGDTQRLNDELTKSKLHLIQLEGEINKLENDKLTLRDTLETIPTSQEFRHLSTCLHLEQQVIMQQLENYRTLTSKTFTHIKENHQLIEGMEKQVASIRNELCATRKEFSNVTNTIPHIQKDCACHAVEQAKLAEELHLLISGTNRIYHHATTVACIIEDLDRECQEAFDSRASSDHELEHNLHHFKDFIRKMEKAMDADFQVKNEKDQLSASKQKLDKDNQKTAQANENDIEAVGRMTRKISEQEIEAEGIHHQLIRLEHLVTAFSAATQTKKEENTRLYRQKRERSKAFFMAFMQMRRMAKESRRATEEIAHMEITQRSINITCNKLKVAIISLREELEHKDILARFADKTLSEKVDKVNAMQNEYYRLDCERQELQEDFRVCQGGLHEHKDRLAYMEDEIKRVKADTLTVQRLLEKAQQDRRSMWMSLQRERKCHFSERERLKQLEDQFERAFSGVLVLRRDLDINLLKCETFTETFDLVSELRACEAALLIDITTQHILKHVERNQIETATYETELRHRSLDSYVQWLHKTADTDIKLLYKRLRWHGTLLMKYMTTRDELKRQLVDTVNRRAQLNQMVRDEKPPTEVIPVVSVEMLNKKEEILSKMLITMERHFFQKNLRHSLLDAICNELTRQIQNCRDTLTADHQTAMLKRDKVLRAKRQHKLALIDVAAIKTQLCHELVLSGNLQNVQQLTHEKYRLPQLQAGDQLLEITDGSELNFKIDNTTLPSL